MRSAIAAVLCLLLSACVGPSFYIDARTMPEHQDGLKICRPL